MLPVVCARLEAVGFTQVVYRVRCDTIATFVRISFGDEDNLACVGAFGLPFRCHICPCAGTKPETDFEGDGPSQVVPDRNGDSLRDFRDTAGCLITR